jgi:hypothetical protein
MPELTHPQLVAGAHEVWQVPGFVRDALYRHEDVDDRLGCQPGHRWRADMFDQRCRWPQSFRDLTPLGLEATGPTCVVGNEHEFAPLDATDQLDLSRVVLGSRSHGQEFKEPRTSARSRRARTSAMSASFLTDQSAPRPATSDVRENGYRAVA